MAMKKQNKWASCSEFYVYEAYNTKAGLSKEIKELQYVVDNSGVNPGQYKAANSAAIATAIAKAKAVLDTEGATMTQYGDALNTLKAETNGLVVVNPLEAGYYMIVSGFRILRINKALKRPCMQRLVLQLGKLWTRKTVHNIGS